jgi:hypothetical protein
LVLITCGINDEVVSTAATNPIISILNFMCFLLLFFSGHMEHPNNHPFEFLKLIMGCFIFLMYYVCITTASFFLVMKSYNGLTMQISDKS